jgi:UDP-N-acetylglucosamine 2-epimerase (non-hydrolysing)
LRFLVSYGTRPEYIKLEPVLRELKKRHISYSVLFTGQHKDTEFRDADFYLDIPESTYRLTSIVSTITEYAPAFIKSFDAVVVQGDTSSAFAVALSAFYCNKKVIHIEAGIRTDSRYEPFPEEINRRLISNLSDYHFCPTEIEKATLIHESKNIYTQEEGYSNIYVVGNTVLDNIKDIKPTYTNLVPIFLHRRDNIDKIGKMYEELDKLAKKHSYLKVIGILAPNSDMNKDIDVKYIEIVEPLSYSTFIDYLSRSKFVITDSGGILDEAVFLGKKVIVPRKLSFCRSMYRDIYFFDSIYDFEYINSSYRIKPCLYYGDGTASKQVVDILENL